jgi:diaminopimelate decarboxylase
MFEPGRVIAGDAGVLVTEVQYLKHGASKNFAIVDAAMNDLMRPAMYEAWHGVKQVTQRADEARIYDVVGPVCESGDWLARSRSLAIESGDLLAIMSAGAYGMTMASNYNTRGRAAEVMVDGDQVHLVRKRENPADLFAVVSLLPCPCLACCAARLARRVARGGGAASARGRGAHALPLHESPVQAQQQQGRHDQPEQDGL